MFSFPSQQVKKVKKGDFLISEPLLPDKNFSRTVILIADDTEGRHIGFVINKIHQEFKLDDLILEYSGKERDIYIGGPVQQDIIQVLHKNGNIQESELIKDGVFWGGDFEQIRQSIENKEMDINECWFFIGYSGWLENQLLNELHEKSWLVLKHDVNTILSVDYTLTWKKCMHLLGEKFDFLTKFPLDPRLN